MASFKWPHWQARALLWCAAGAVGLAAVAFARAADLAQAGFRAMLSIYPWAPWLVAPLGFALLAWLTRRFFRGAEGSGIPQTIFALRSDAGASGLALLRPVVVVARMVLASAALLCGASIGREGPTVHVGAALAHSVWRWMPHGSTAAQRRTLILAGGAAGVAAAFNTPLAGIVFAIEELSRSFEERASGTTLTAVILSGLVAIALLGDYSYFGQPQIPSAASRISFATLALAIVCGVAGGLFSRLTLSAAGTLRSPLTSLRGRHSALFGAACGLIIAALGTASGGLTYGTGYLAAKELLEGGQALPWLYAPERAAATLVSYLSGVPAGLLAPSLSVGAGLGQLVGHLLSQASVIPFAITGMCGYLAGVTQAPLTSLVIVMEVTANHSMILPLMVTAAIATAVSKLFSRPLYQSLARRYDTEDIAPDPAPVPGVAAANGNQS